MKVLLIADIHDNLPNLQIALAFAREKKIKQLICCGDIGSVETLQYMVDNFAGVMWVVLGNADENKNGFEEIAQVNKNLNLFLDEGIFSLQNNKILLVHQPEKYQQHLDDDSIQYIFYGHTHKPWQEFKEEKTILNPGNLSNYIYAPTLAVWQVETGKFSLIPLQLIHNRK